jgi:hypothetical protein
VGERTEFVVVSGSRDWTDYSFVHGRLQMLRGNEHVRVGDCPTGVDRFVKKACRGIGIPCEVFEADWKTHGKAAGPIRNEAMFVDPEDRILHFIAFWIGNSAGTRDAVRRAWKHDIPWIEIHRRPTP